MTGSSWVATRKISYTTKLNGWNNYTIINDYTIINNYIKVYCLIKLCKVQLAQHWHSFQRSMILIYVNTLSQRLLNII